MVDSCTSLVQQSLGALCGAARLHLLSAAQMEDGTWVVEFGYALNGALVEVFDSRYAARFEIRNNEILAYTLHFRTYIPTGQHIQLLPVRQAMVAMSALNREDGQLRIAYRDNGGTLTVGWVATEP